MIEKSSKIFEVLQRIAPDAATFATRETGIVLDARKVEHAIDASGQHCVLVPLESDDTVPRFGNYSSISIEVLATDQSAPLDRTLVIRCIEPILVEQFSLIVDEMLEALRRNPKAGASECLKVLERWRQLLELKPSLLLSVPAQAGLLAELHLLEEVFRGRRPDGLDTWLGADRSRHDFVASGAVEVKATLSRNNLAVVVHGAMQLEPPSSGDLLLYVEQLEQVPTGESVSGVVSRLLQGGIDRVEFLKKLKLSGFELHDSRAYSNYKFAVIRRELFAVDAGFPRISAATISTPSWMDLISDLEYKLDLASIDSISSGSDALDRAAAHLGAS